MSVTISAKERGRCVVRKLSEAAGSKPISSAADGAAAVLRRLSKTDSGSEPRIFPFLSKNSAGVFGRALS